ncbi:DUF2059 domain-containing protein [Undibacterium sp. RuTC16W]|uniref:DUF2059 domain-containing protein n=1 Tax=Undibacterium sp. RuTC16W TaxID=3413048 RepID=UPI003BF2B1C6
MDSYKINKHFCKDHPLLKMTSIKLVFLLTLGVFLSNAHAEDTKPTEESIKQLFVMTNTGSLIQSVSSQLDAMMKSVRDKSLKGSKPTEEQEKALDKFQKKIVVIFKEEMSWDKLEPTFIKIYSDSLTQEEVDGMIVFYQSKAGIALIKKMPTIMQSSMGLMQKQMLPMMKKMEQASKELAVDMEKAKKK